MIKTPCRCTVTGFLRFLFVALSALTIPGARADDVKQSSSNDTTGTKAAAEPLRLAIVGLVHGHVYGFLYAACGREDVQVVGIQDPSDNLLDRYGKRHHLPQKLWYQNLDRLLDENKPEAVAVFTDIRDHRMVVEACAKRGVHVMMEKPLAVSMDDARAIERAATAGRIHVLVNYETTWYPNTAAMLELARDGGQLGELRRIIALTGHKGPRELGMPQEFLDFLLDPERNGAGALFDFGCYGANLATCLMNGARPVSVTAVTQRLKTDPAYARVDDEATIVLAYKNAQAVLQPSWNWPHNRKDMEVYGERGSLLTVEQGIYRLRVNDQPERRIDAPAPAAPRNDPISYLKAVVRGEIEPSGPSSLPVNLVVTEILDAARRSAREGRTIALDASSKN